MRADIIGKFLFLNSLGVLILLAGCQDAPERKPDTSEPEQSPVAVLLKKLLPENAQSRRQKLLDRLSSSDADMRRQGVLMLGEGEATKWEVTPKILSIMAQGDSDAQVRVASVQVLGKSGSQKTVEETLARTAQDTNKFVRQESIEGLVKYRSPVIQQVLLERLAKDSDPAIRSRSALELANYPERVVAKALIEALADEDFSVTYRARGSLNQLTGKDFGYELKSWQDYMMNTPEPLIKPSEPKK